MMIKETYQINQLVCDRFKGLNPNLNQEKELIRVMREAILNTFQGMKGKGRPYVVFTSHKDHLEDRGTVKYLFELCNLDASYCALEDLKIDRNGLYDANDRKIDILYRQTYPIESQ